jgi:hypothetical protein
MKLFECFSAPGFHTCIATTFDLNFEAYESIVLARLKEAKCNNNVIVADARMVAQALGGDFALPKHAGRQYSVVEASVGEGGVFHPKVVLQLGASSGRLIVGSANLTAAGLAGNLEIVGVIDAAQETPIGVPLLRQALRYVGQTVGASAHAARQQIEWAVQKSPWLRDGQDSDAPVAAEGGLAALLHRTPTGPGIAEQFRLLIGDERVRRLVVMSPYWDPNLAALKWLRAQLQPTLTTALIQPHTKLFPVKAMGIGKNIKIHDLRHLKPARSRFSHAKLFVAQTARADHVLYGSANCTQAALGTETFPGVNEEVSLYRRLRRGEAVELLRLEEALNNDSKIEPSELPEFAPSDDIPLKDLQERLPGRFEVHGRTLVWWPTAAFNVDDASVELLDVSMKSLETGLRLLRNRDAREVTITTKQAPAFARVRLGHKTSGLALVTVAESIQASQRKIPTAKIKHALEHFDDEDMSEGLWLLEVITEIHHAETDQSKTDKPEPRAATKGKKAKAPDDRTLSYEDFIKAKQDQVTWGEGESTLASSHTDAVRSALNFLLGRHRKLAEVDEHDDLDASDLFDMKDETSDGEEQIETGEDTKPLALSEQRQEDAKLKRQQQRRQKYYRDTAVKIGKAVEGFLRETREKVGKEEITGVDLLRLRALLMVVLAAGTSKSSVAAPALDKPMSRIQVLPIAGDGGWPRLAMQLLYEFFRRDPPLARLARLPAVPNGALPLDLTECWATCYWTACAVQSATDDRGKPVVAHRSQELAAQVYGTIALDPVAATSDVVSSVMQALSDRYASRLGVDVDKVNTEHLRLSRSGGLRP